MRGANSKKQKETTRDRHLKWINYYSSKDFGIWVECTDCKKWRRTFQYSESHEVPEHWCCSLLTLDSGEKGNCNIPEEDCDEQYLEYCPGSVVWAKLEGYPWWPAMVDEDPDVEEFSWRGKGTLHYNVTFLDEKPSRAWIPEMFVCPFWKHPKLEKGSVQRLKQNRYSKAISKAKERAESAMKMAIKDRLQTYSFAHLYKGHWPAAPNFEDCNEEENESKNAETLADTLLKELDELGSVYSSDNNDEMNEKDFSEKENNTIKKRKQVSKSSSASSLKKETYNAKYLNNRDFIPENEAVFPFMKKKKCVVSSTLNETLNISKEQNLIEYEGSNIIPLQMKETKVIKRKFNRKFTPRKLKIFDKTNDSLSVDIIDVESSDSEPENSKPLDAVIVSKETDSKTVHNSEKRSVAEGNVLLNMPSDEMHKADEKSKNVEPMNEEFNVKSTISIKKGIHSSNLSSKEEILKHIDESISKVLEFIENDSDELDECKISDREKTDKESNEPETKKVKQKKPQNSCVNSKQSNHKIGNLGKNITHTSKVSPKNRVLQNNESDSPSKIKKQIRAETSNQIKKSQKKIVPLDGKMNTLPKQPNNSFSVPVKHNAEQNEKLMLNKDLKGGNMNKEKKTLKLTNQNPSKDKSSMKIKPNFKLPNKQVLDKIRNEKPFAETSEQNTADIKSKISDEGKKNLVASSEGTNDSINKDPQKNLESEKYVSESKEENHELISNGNIKPIENRGDNFFYVSLSDEEMDCET